MNDLPGSEGGEKWSKNGKNMAEIDIHISEKNTENHNIVDIINRIKYSLKSVDLHYLHIIYADYMYISTK